MFKVRVEGGQQLARRLASLPLRVSKPIMRGALARSAEPIRGGMATRAPRAPGAPDMADHIVISIGRSRGISVAVGPAKDLPGRPGATYPMHQEFGTVRHAAQPFARPAFDADGPKVIPLMVGEVWRALIGRGIGSTRGPSETTETFAEPSAPRPVGGPGGGGLL